MSEKRGTFFFILTVDYLCSEDGDSWFARNVSKFLWGYKMYSKRLPFEGYVCSNLCTFGVFPCRCTVCVVHSWMLFWYDYCRIAL